MPKVDVSVGELFDKLSILEIKASKGLDVDTEKQKLSGPGTPWPMSARKRVKQKSK